MFDHMGGINTLLHIIFNGGTIISPQKSEYILELIKKYNIELLPTTPTFANAFDEWNDTKRYSLV